MGDRSEMAGFYVAAAIVGTCHDSGGGVSGHGMSGPELQISLAVTGQGMVGAGL